MKVGLCNICGKDAAWNTPYFDENNRELICNHCAKSVKDVVLQGVKQHLDEKACYVYVNSYMFNGIVLSKDDNNPDAKWNCWTNGGSRWFHLTEEERKLPYNKVLFLVSFMENQGLTRCSGCGKNLFKSEIAGYPLFAGQACTECWEKHLKHLDDERKAGKVCRMCREPYSNCCC